jgi:putative SOS response-associated peptidase YedK
VCGRFTSTADYTEIADRFAITLAEALQPRYNVAPAQSVLTVRVEPETGARIGQSMRWGLVPHWAKDPSVSYRMINARAETVAEKPAYRKLLAKKRCLVPADGFYEWRVGPDGKKQPVRFTLAGGGLFAFAGLWTSWLDRESGELLDSCTIVTTTANELCAKVHDRMPVILPVEAEPVWLDPGLAPEQAKALLVPYPASAMRAAVASTLVNSTRNEGPELLVAEAGGEPIVLS